MNVKRAYFPIILLNVSELVSFNEQIDMEESKLFNEDECEVDEMNAACSCHASCGNDYSRGSKCPCYSSCGNDYSRDSHCPCHNTCGNEYSRG